MLTNIGSSAPVFHFKGNRDLLNFQKTAFLCSRSISSTAVLKCYDWAIEQREKGVCVLSGFQSQIEKDVLHYLLQGMQPIIIALARGLKKRIEPELQDAFSSGRILMVSVFPETITRPTSEAAELRNRMMIEMADHIVFGFVSETGNLAKLKVEYSNKKEIHTL
jgi:predicted Rossmann fold nucleotide-binding protein DprA/Smf involved in DNA uptake